MATTAATMTGPTFDALPYEEGRRWELVEGDLIPVSSPTLDHQEIVYRVLSAFKQWLAADEGIASHDVEFALADDTRVRPDVWLVLAPRMAQLDRARVPIPGCPDLAVEVISSSEYTAESLRKVNAYLTHGVREVWQIYPKSRQVVSYMPRGEVRKFGIGDALTSPLIPDFRLTIAELFRP